jgi:hypothetical protein
VQCAALNLTNINVQRAHVPVDPALAIPARFGELAK